MSLYHIFLLSDTDEGKNNLSSDDLKGSTHIGAERYIKLSETAQNIAFDFLCEIAGIERIDDRKIKCNAKNWFSAINSAGILPKVQKLLFEVTDETARLDIEQIEYQQHLENIHHIKETLREINELVNLEANTYIIYKSLMYSLDDFITRIAEKDHHYYVCGVVAYT